MILDRLAAADRYAALHPAFKAAFEFLRRPGAAALPPGRIELDGPRLYVAIDHKDGRGREGARLEAHRKYIDIQFTVAGDEVIGWRPAADCTRRAVPYDPEKDIEFFADAPETWLAVPPGTFAIFFPEDGHAPLAGSGPVRKLIVKVAL